MQGFLRAFLQSGRQRHRASYPERHHHPGHPSYGSGKPGAFIKQFDYIKGNRLAKAAVENALWELMVQRTGKSLKTLLGGTQKEIKVGVSLGIEKDINVLFKEIEHYLELGYHRTKIKIHPGRDIEVVKAIRKEFGDITLTVDANSAYTLKDIDLFRAMDEYHLQYIEQPLGEEDIVDHATLQKAIETPVCLDESIVSYEAAEVGNSSWQLQGHQYQIQPLRRCL